MTLENIIRELNLTVMAGEDKLQRPVKGGYASDLLSDVMGRARESDLWITMQTHKNIVAVASLKDLAAILIVNGGQPDDDTLEAARLENIVLLQTNERSFNTCGKLFKLMERDALV